MKAAVIHNGFPAYSDFDDPGPVEGREILKVEAAALSRLDMAIAAGRHYIKPYAGPFVPGREGVGVRPDGRRVYFNVNAGVAPFGSMAERTLVDPALTFPVPDQTNSVVAAALGNAGLAAWLPLSWRARMRPGETVMILGATGISGQLAVGAARQLKAGTIIAVGRNPNALARTRKFGADVALNLDTTADFARRVLAVASEGVDVILDYLSGPIAETALSLLRVGGRLVHIGSTIAPTFPVTGGVLRKSSLDILGFAYYHAPIEQQAEAFKQLCIHATQGRLPIDIEPLPLAEIARAWKEQADGHSRRFVLLPEPLGA